MKRRHIAFMLVLLMLAQVFAPEVVWAKSSEPSKQTTVQLVKMGALDPKTYPKLDNKAILAIQKQARNNQKGSRTGSSGFFSVGSPYLPGQNPSDNEKAGAYGNLHVDFVTEGLKDNGVLKPFQWNEIFGTDSNGNPGTANIYFVQRDAETNNKINTFKLTVDKAGKYSLNDLYGKPAKLPLYSKALEPYKYEVELETGVSEKVTLLTLKLSETGSESPSYTTDSEGKLVADIPLYLKIGQTASTKFVSKWNTNVQEANRPKVVGGFNNKTAEDFNYFPFPINDTGVLKIRREHFDLNNDDWPGYMPQLPSQLREVPNITVEEDMLEDPSTYTIDKNAKHITANGTTYKYDLQYDVINGGKLTMTEIIPVTFDANGGKFASITEEGADQKIVKEVDYDGTLTDKAEEPTQDRETFKGWSTTTDGKTPATDADFKNITKAKTFYAIWVNNPITAEELTVNESFKEDGATEYVNDFIPPLDTLKGQVKIKDANGDPQPLAADDTFEILKDDGQTAFTQAEIDDGTLKDYLYEKLKEKDNPKGEPTRVETVKAKVTYANGTSRTVDIPIKVIKNIYEAKTLTDKPFYVPENYVKVTLDPTTTAKDPQKTYYYVNPEAKVVIPGSDPTGTDGNVFTKWLIKGTTDEYKLADKPRHMFAAETTIEAQYEKEKQGIINIKYVDENGKEIDSKYHVDGVDYPSTKEGKSGALATEKEYPTPGPAFKGYIYTSRDAIKGQHYNDPATDTIKYQYTKKITTDDKSKSWVHFPVVFDANTGEFTGGKAKVTVYVYFDGSDNTPEPVTFEEVREAVEETYGKPSKANENFIEWHDKTKSGSAVADAYEIKFKGWDWEADPENGYVPEIFYAHYGKASALVKYLDLDGKPIADEFKIDGVEYPTEKEGTLDETIASDVFTADTAPKFTGYKFNRIELNPKDGKYALDNKATIKIYYEKLPDVIPSTGNEKPDGYVEVKFVPTDKAKDTTEKIFYVNPKKDVTIPIADPVAKATYTFKEWKMGANADGAVYTPSTAQKFTDDLTVITATYEETENIIPYDPSVPDPMVRPDGYVRVTFAADKGLSLTEQKAYYVKKNAGITLGNAELKKPAYEAQTGYKFKEWDKEDTLTIAEADILVTAKATKLDTVIPEKDDKGNPNEKPNGYKEVTFVIKDDDKAKGSITGVAKFYVNPTEYVTINPPATNAETGFEFGAWDKDVTRPTVYDKDTTITGSFNGLKDVIPKTKDDESEKPKGYVTVTYELEKLDGKEAGKIVDGETITYFVKPNTDVTIPQPKTLANTGYEFKAWNPDTSQNAQYSKDTTVKGNFKKLDDIIPSTNGEGQPNAKPDGYVTVTFDKGEHGKEITGQTVYYVNPTADPAKTIGEITKPTVKAETGYKFTGWDKADADKITGTQDITVTAKYEDLKDVIPKTTKDESEKPKGYITVTFDKGEHGSLEGKTVYYVNPNKAVVLKDKAPTAVPNTGYKFARWDVSIDQAIQYKDGATITALYNDLGNISATKVEGYVKVEFRPGDNGSLSGTTEYWIKPGVEVNIPAPTVKPNVGYKFNKWDKSLTVTASAGDPTYEITAQYEGLGDIIPQKNTDGLDKPNGYVTVTFDKGEHGKNITGQTVYYVNPNKKVKLTAPMVTADLGFKQKANDAAWDKALEDTFANDTKITAQYEELKDVIPKTKDDESEKPEGYITVKLIPTDKATDETKAEKIYFVNPKKEVTITNKPVGTKVKDANDIAYDYTFAGWTVTRGTIASWNDENIKGKFIQDTEITAKYSLKYIDITPRPLAKDNVVTPIGEMPEANTLIKNIPGSENDPLPKGTTFKYTDDGKPDVNNSGKTTAKVEVKYPNGKTVVVEVPITVVDNVVPQTGDEKPNVPANYVKVDFVIDPAEGGKIADGAITVYYVNPEQEVIIPQPDTIADTSYTFAGWNTDTTAAKKYESETTVKGSFTKGNDVIPKTNEDGSENTKPEGYVTLTFDKGEHGKEITGQTVYYVNPKADPAKTLREIKKPEVKAATGWKQKADADAWDTPDTFEIKADKTVKAQYEAIDDVIPKTKEDDSEKPAGYITVKFSTEKDGKITGTDETEKIVYVNPDKAVVLKGQDPEVTPNTGFTFADWDMSIQSEIKYHDNDVIKAKYNAIDDVIPQENPTGSDKPEGYLTVTFAKGEHGELSGTTVYYVKPNKEVTVPAPTVTPATGWKQKTGTDAWDKPLTQTFTEDTTITAQYAKSTTDQETKPGRRSGGSSGGSGGVLVPSTPKPTPEKPSEGDLNKDDHYQYLIGYPDGTFAPNRGMTRAEVATMFTRLLKDRPVKWLHYSSGLSDIYAGDWYADTVGYAVEKGIVSGYPDGTFRPNQPITRAEFASIASRFAQLTDDQDISFIDLDASHWGYKAVRSAASHGWISGYPDNTFRPEQAISRAEVTSITNRMLNRYADLDWIDAHRAEVIRFSDVGRSDWFFEPVMEATMGHDFTRDKDGKAEHWTGLNGKTFI